MKYSDLNKNVIKRLEKNNFVICEDTEFDSNFANYLEGTKHKNVTIKNCEIVAHENRESTLIKNSSLIDCQLMYSQIDISNSKLENVNILNCNFFSMVGSEINQAKFIGGIREIVQSHPLTFDFPHGTIMNPKPDTIDFFGYHNTYQYFRERLEKYPYNKYATELGSIIVMGTRGSNDER